MTRARVIRSHVSTYPKPIGFRAGETVTVGRHDDEYPGWIWTTTADGNSGWAPEALLEIDGDAAVAKDDYTARELNTEVGDVVEVVRELNGWLWVRAARDEEGWVPAETVSAG